MTRYVLPLLALLALACEPPHPTQEAAVEASIPPIECCVRCDPGPDCPGGLAMATPACDCSLRCEVHDDCPPDFHCNNGQYLFMAHSTPGQCLWNLKEFRAEMDRIVSERRAQRAAKQEAEGLTPP